MITRNWAPAVSFFLATICIFSVVTGLSQVAPVPAPVLLPATMPATRPIFDSVRLTARISDTVRSQLDANIIIAAQAIADDTNPDGQTAARRFLIQSLRTSRGDEASSDYINVLSKSIIAHLSPLLTPQASLRVKIEVGFVAAAVAEAQKNVDALTIIETLLQDQQPAALLVGMRGAVAISPAVLRSTLPQAQQAHFIALVRDGVKRDIPAPLGAAISEDGYNALSRHNDPKLADAQIIGLLVPAMLDMIESRTKLLNEKLLPSVQADFFGLVMLMSKKVWPLLTPQEKVRTLTAADNLISLTSQWYATAKPGTAQYLIIALVYAGRTLQTFSKDDAPNADPTLKSAADRLSGLGMGSTATSATDAATNLTTALQAFGKRYGPIPDPPQISPR